MAPDGCGECTPDCEGLDGPKVCGDDGCGGTCGECDGTDVCQEDGTCAPCVPACDGKACGDDGCGGSCGECGPDEICSPAFACVVSGPTCEGYCGLAQSADGSCYCDSSCFGYGDCCDDICVFCEADFPDAAPDGCGECVPSCEGLDGPKACGDDGCGGSCGECAAGWSCDAEGACYDPSLIQGNACASAFVVDVVPYYAEGDTSDATGEFHFTEGQCPGESSGWGAASADHVYVFAPTMDGIYTITLDATFDSLLYVATDCGAVGASCVGAEDDGGSSTAEILALDAVAGTTYYIIADGYSNTTDMSGPYVLTIDEPCVPGCGLKVCGDDGCGGSCGECGTDELCDADGACVLATSVPGNTCALPIEVDALPFVAEGDTGAATGDLSFGYDTCPGEMSAMGGGSHDHVYLFTPVADGVYTIELASSFDSVVYVVTDCAAVDTSCAGAADNAVAGGTETLEIALVGGTPYFVIVDGYSETSNYTGPYTLTIAPPCVPACGVKVCGDDGCGGSCGECPAGDVCQEDGTCAPCVPDCDGKSCGDDGCGGECGECGLDEVCSPASICVVEGPTCEGYCGLTISADGSCFCDADCFGYGDCCEDICDVCTDVFPDDCGTTPTDSVDLGGWAILQTESAKTFTIPEATLVAPGAFLIVARDAERAAFETFWGVTLGGTVAYLNAGNSFPSINGDETYALTDPLGVTVDGPTIPMTSGDNYQRLVEGAAGDLASWAVADSVPGNATPGASTLVPAGTLITEFSDATGTGNYVYEFIEVQVGLAE